MFIEGSAIIAALMTANGVLFTVLFALADRSSLFFRIPALLFLLLNLVLTYTDQMGIYDYIIMSLNILAILSLLYISISSYRKNSDKSV